MNPPLVSIITVTYNAAPLIERTLKSIASQSYANVECIVVDGNSTDATMQIVSKHKSTVTKWVSEPDQGLYYAMNKGLRMASGDYVWFVNAGDEIASPDTLAQIFSNNDERADVYYGDTLIVSDDGTAIGPRRLRPPEVLTWRSFQMGMLVCHQAFIARRSLCSDYDVRYRLSADFDWCIRVLKRSQTIRNTHMTLARFLQGGMTKQHHAKGLRERFCVMRRHYGLASALWHHFLILLRAIRQ